MWNETTVYERGDEDMDEATRARLLLDASMASLQHGAKDQGARFLAEAEKILITDIYEDDEETDGETE